MEKILIIEDEQDIAELIKINLVRHGYSVEVANYGLAGLELARQFRPQLVLLDVMMPGIDGFKVLKQLRRDELLRDVPVIFLTAKSQTEDKISGLELGADDYITKPFSPKELLLRVQAVLKRVVVSGMEEHFSYGPWEFDKIKHLCLQDGQSLELTATEYKLLLYLVERAGHVQSRHDLLQKVWGYSSEAQSRTLDTHMKRLRQKISGHENLLETVRGVGYMISAL